ncbi:MAG: cytochrome C, partial [Desulfobacterota bacterium]|nr:cytochrome C [Thermodesulfobacteriota bacterium]
MAGVCVSILLVMCFPIQADEFTKKDLDRWEKEFMTVVAEGDKLFHSSSLGKNKVSCDQCHPNGANTHPETYPKFQKQLGRVVSLGEMVNWCIINPLEGKALALDSKEMVAILAY